MLSPPPLNLPCSCHTPTPFPHFLVLTNPSPHLPPVLSSQPPCPHIPLPSLNLPSFFTLTSRAPSTRHSSPSNSYHTCAAKSNTNSIQSLSVSFPWAFLPLSYCHFHTPNNHQTLTCAFPQLVILSMTSWLPPLRRSPPPLHRAATTTPVASLLFILSRSFLVFFSFFFLSSHWGCQVYYEAKARSDMELLVSGSYFPGI